MNETRLCGWCRETRPLTDFGRNRARSDGKNLYCKPCIRKRANEDRRRKFITRMQGLGVPVIFSDVPECPNRKKMIQWRQVKRATDLVRDAIREGAQTREQIGKVTNLSLDEVCDVLAELSFTQEIVSQVVNGKRVWRAA